MNRGLSIEWEVRELLGLWLQQLFSLFSGYHARNLAIILSHLNVIFFHIYSEIAAVFLTMALLFRCLLAYRLKKKANVRLFILLLSFSYYLRFIYAPVTVGVGLSGFIKRCRKPAFTGSTKCTHVTYYNIIGLLLGGTDWYTSPPKYMVVTPMTEPPIDFVTIQINKAKNTVKSFS